jgi:hypothetical protein
VYGRRALADHAAHASHRVENYRNALHKQTGLLFASLYALSDGSNASYDAALRGAEMATGGRVSRCSQCGGAQVEDGCAMNHPTCYHDL